MPGGRVPGRGPPRHRAETGSRGRSLPLSTGTDRGSPGPWGPMSRNQSPVADGLLPTSPWEVLRMVTGWWGLWGSAQGLRQRRTGCAAPGTSHAAGALRSPQEALVQQQRPGTHRGRPWGHRGQRGPRNLPPPSHHSPTPLPPTSDPAILPAPHLAGTQQVCEEGLRGHGHVPSTPKLNLVPMALQTSRTYHVEHRPRQRDRIKARKCPQPRGQTRPRRPEGPVLGLD